MSLQQHYIISQRKELKFTPAKQEHIYMNWHKQHALCININ